MRRILLSIVVVTVSLLWSAPDAMAQADDSGNGTDGLVDAGTDDGTATGEVEVTIPGSIQQTGGSSGSSGPNCTQEDGTRAYLRYEGLMFTTMQEQRDEIRPEEQRAGVYLHVYCGDEYVDFRFFAEPPAEVVIDPRVLADSVQITPAAPVIRTNPATGSHLVNLEAWFWTQSWASVSETATAGPVTVTVSAAPTSLEIDPGDGTAPFTCAGPQAAYDPDRSPDSQSSDCTHLYRSAGRFTATATVVYDVTFTSNVGVAGDLPAIEPDSQTAITVRESQAIVGG